MYLDPNISRRSWNIQGFIFMKLSLQFINTNNNILLRAGKTVITLSDLIWQRAVSKSLPKTETDMINLTMRSQEREGLVLSKQSCSSPRSSTFFFSSS